MLLNIGCGGKPLIHAVNLDMRSREECGISDKRYEWIVSDFFHIPFQNHTFSKIVTTHTIEHVSHLQTNLVLQEWKRVLVPSGLLNIRCPNAASFARRLPGASPAKQESLLHILWGGQDYPGNFHLNGFTPETLMLALKRNGFREFDLKFQPCYSIHDAIINITAAKKGV